MTPDVLVAGWDKLLKIDDLAKLMLIGGSSYSLGARLKEEGEAWTLVSTPVTADVETQFVKEIIEWERLTSNKKEHEKITFVATLQGASISRFRKILHESWLTR